MKTIKLNNGKEISVNALVKKLKAIQQEIYALQGASKGYTYNYTYQYNKFIDLDGNKYNTYLKDLSSTREDKNGNLLISDQVYDMLMENYQVTPNAVADLLNTNLRKLILGMIEKGELSHRLEDINKIMK